MSEHNDEFAALRRWSVAYAAAEGKAWPNFEAAHALQALHMACTPERIAALLAAADRAKELEADARRLDYLIRHEAWIGWNREGDSCRVWVRDDDEDDHIPEPVCRWHVTFDNPRAAIDAAIDIAQGTAT